MSDTPITDKKAIDITGGLYGVTHLRRNPKGNFVRVNFARQLERENAVLRSLVREAMAEHVDLYDLDKAEDFIARAKNVLGEAKPDA